MPAAESAKLFAACTAHGAASCYVSFNGRSALVAPAIGTFGNSGRNIFRDTGFHNLDLSIAKNWKFYEKLTVQFRAEMLT